MSPRSEAFELPGSVLDHPIRGRLVLPDGHGPFPAVLCVHGYSLACEWGFWPELGRRLAARGIASVRFNHSGDGFGADLRTVERPDCIARASYVDELEDLDRVRAHLDRSAAVDATRLAVVGHSRGGAMAIVHAAERRDYRAVVGWAAMERILRFSPERLAQWRRDGSIEVAHQGAAGHVRLDLSVLERAERNRERLDVLAAARRLDCALLAIQGDRDRSLPEGAAEQIAAAAPHGKALRIPGAGHLFGARDPLVSIPARLERLFVETVTFLAAGLLRPR